MNTLAFRILRIRNARGWSQTDLANYCGVKQPTVSRWEKGESVPPDKAIAKLARLGNIGEAELKYGQQANNQLPLVPVFGYVGAGEEVIIMDAASPLEYVAAPPGQDANADLIAVRIKGDSMRPLRDGWLVYYTKDADGVEPHCLNQVCVCQLADGRILIKELRRGHMEGRFTLHSWSAGADPLEDVALIWAVPVSAIVPC